MTLSNEQLMEAFELAAAAGIDFIATSVGFGRMMDWETLNAGQVARLVAFGPDDFWPHYFDITQEAWRAFCSFTETKGACSATTRAGKPCGGHVKDFMGGPNSFRPGFDDRCKAHQVG